ncbi:hypothetical protein N9K95_02725 [Schleiferiaceae bacterium]|nr:hypothetical protein [Schleiferiaceae bacterium]
MNFICNDCNHEFVGNDFTTECVACNSANIKVKSERPPIPWKKFLIGLGITLLIILMTKMCSGDDAPPSPPPPGGQTHIVKFENSGATWKVVLQKINNNGQTVADFPERIQKIINNSTNRPVSFDGDTGELFPCLSDTVESTFSFIFKDPKSSAKVISSHLSISGSVNSNAECPLTAEEDDFGFNTNSENCQVSIKIISQSRKSEIEKGGIWISVNGKNGKYEKRISWNPINENLKKWDVFIVCNNRKDTVEIAKKNGQSYTCSLPLTPPEHDLIQKAIKNNMNSLLDNCDSRVALKELSTLLEKIKVKGEINSKQCDWAELYNKINAGCPNTMYELASPIALSKDGKSVVIKIKTKK